VDAGKLGKPPDTLRTFPVARTTTMDSLATVLPNRKAQETLRPTHQHMIQPQKDLFGLL
jgi:hypothetical protein